jgi:hypothetical protein
MYSGKRSVESQNRRDQKRAARQFVWDFSFNDYLIGEKVCRTDPSDVADYLYVMFGQDFDDTVVPSVFRGVVISDAYGRGDFQK